MKSKPPLCLFPVAIAAVVLIGVLAIPAIAAFTALASDEQKNELVKFFERVSEKAKTFVAELEKAK